MYSAASLHKYWVCLTILDRMKFMRISCSHMLPVYFSVFGQFYNSEYPPQEKHLHPTYLPTYLLPPTYPHSTYHTEISTPQQSSEEKKKKKSTPNFTRESETLENQVTTDGHDKLIQHTPPKKRTKISSWAVEHNLHSPLVKTPTKERTHKEEKRAGYHAQEWWRLLVGRCIYSLHCNVVYSTRQGFGCGLRSVVKNRWGYATRCTSIVRRELVVW